MKSLLTLALLTASLATANAAIIVIPVAGGDFEPSAGTPSADPNNLTPGSGSYVSGTTGSGATASGYYYQSTPGGSIAITGFTIANSPDASGLFNGAYTNFGGHSGQAAFFNDDNAISQPTHVPTLTSNALTSIVAGAGYTASIEIGNQVATGDYGDPGTVTLKLYANNVQVASVATLSASLADGTWGNFSVSLTAAQTALLGGQTLTFQVVGDPTSQYGTASPASQPLFDNVTLIETTAAVPEPSTYALMLAGVGALFFVARARKLS